MKKYKLIPSFEDNRGVITDLIEGEEIHAITYISFNKGSVRANHYHKETIQWNYVLSGEVLLKSQLPGLESKEVVMKKGDLIVTYPNEAHALQGVTEAELLVFTKGPRGGKEYESDTFRLNDPLIERR